MGQHKQFIHTKLKNENIGSHACSIGTFSYTYVLSRDLAVLQSIADLAGEIAALEQEVIRKELHLLSLYRRAFDQHLSDSCSVSEVHNSGCWIY